MSSEPQSNPPVLSARGLRRDFAGFVAVKDVDLDVHHGKIHALIGPNGADKTTVFNLLTKFLQGELLALGPGKIPISGSP